MEIVSTAFKGTPWLRSLGEFPIVNGILFSYQGPGGHVVIPEDVMKIGWGTFRHCTSLTSVVIPDSVVEISWNAFIGCRHLTMFVSTNSVAEHYAEENCIPFHSIKSDEHSFEIRKNATGCTITKYCGPDTCQLIIPQQIQGLPVTEIGLSAFRNCQSITIEIPNCVTKISRSAFENCVNLAYMEIPDSVKVIESYAFWNCDRLTRVVIPKNIAKVDPLAFAGCPHVNIFRSKDRAIAKFSPYFEEIEDIEDGELPF